MRDKLSNRPTLRRRFLAQGFSLIELMIALVISLLIIAVVGYIYVGNRNAFRAQTADSRLTDNARIAIEYISRDLRLAGKFGCSRADVTDNKKIDGSVMITALPPLLAATNIADLDALSIPQGEIGNPGGGGPLLEPGRMIRSYDGGANFSGPALSATGPRRLNTDVLEILKVGSTASHLVIPMENDNSDLLLKSILPGAAPGGRDLQTLVVADCNYSEIIKGRISDSASAPGGVVKIDNPTWNKNGRIGTRNFGIDATVSRFEPVVYMVQNPPASSSMLVPRLVRFGLKRIPIQARLARGSKASFRRSSQTALKISKSALE